MAMASSGQRVIELEQEARVLKTSAYEDGKMTVLDTLKD
jgi:hypothetical protein